MPRTRSYCGEVSRKRTRGQVVIASFFPTKEINKAHSVIKLLIDGRPCPALMDLGCSRFFMNNSNCVTWSKMSVNVLEVKGENLKSQWIVVLNPVKATYAYSNRYGHSSDIQKAQVLFNPNGFWIEHGASNKRTVDFWDSTSFWRWTLSGIWMEFE